uniref:Retrotransposable element Tf2 n=1 Tax=Cajanus cajan TaxID=3821 RepID=A0A151RNX6_CAJCA|nr:Retrotransposable element Tf2 [Cajanus cajan]
MSVILVIIDRFTKYAHFIALGHPFSAAKIAELFMNTVVRLHGWPEEIISDRDTIFLSNFWTGLMQSHSVKLLRSTAFHPQTDGQTENLNKSLEAYLRCATGSMPKQWTNHLAMAELWYNTKFHTATQMTPFEALYGYVPSMPNLVDNGETLIEAVEYTVKTREQIGRMLQENLYKAQERMRMYADKKRTDKEFKDGDLVYLKIQPFKQHSLANTSFHKLSARYYGPYRIIERIGKVAYRLDLPADTRIHNVFHVSLLKKHHGSHVVSEQLPRFNEEGDLLIKPLAILDRRVKKKNNKAITEVLVQWEHTNPEDATWKELHELQIQYPDFKWQVE